MVYLVCTATLLFSFVLTQINGNPRLNILRRLVGRHLAGEKGRGLLVNDAVNILVVIVAEAAAVQVGFQVRGVLLGEGEDVVARSVGVWVRCEIEIHLLGRPAVPVFVAAEPFENVIECCDRRREETAGIMLRDLVAVGQDELDELPCALAAGGFLRDAEVTERGERRDASALRRVADSRKSPK